MSQSENKSLIGKVIDKTKAVFGGNKNPSLSLPESKVEDLVATCLKNQFNKYMKRDDLRVENLSCTPDWTTSENDNDFVHYNVQGNFINFPIDDRLLYGRLKTTVKINRKDNTDVAVQKVTLNVNDQLSDELRKSKVCDYMNKKYHDPRLDISNERTEIYHDEICSKVTCVVNKTEFVYLRMVFEKQSSTKTIGIFEIIETPWNLKKPEELFKGDLPFIKNEKNKEEYKKMEKNVKKLMFDQMRGFYKRAVDEGNPRESRSKIESVTKSELKKATNEKIEFELDLVYRLGWFIGTRFSVLLKWSQRYSVPVTVFCDFNSDTKTWDYKTVCIDETKIIAKK